MLRKNSFFLIICCLILLLIFSLNFLSSHIRNFFYNLSYPVQKNLYLLGLKSRDFFSVFSQKKVLLNKEVKELQKENEKLLTEITELQNLKEENLFLRKAFDLGLEKEYKVILVDILSKEATGDFILISKGEKDGISKDMVVITNEKVLVGKVDEVLKNFSKVKLISNEKISFDIEISSEKERVYGLAKGIGNLSLRIKFIPKDKEIKEGDLVATTALAGAFPKGLLLGKIKKVSKTDLEPFAEAEIDWFFNFGSEFLFVIKN